MALKAVAKLAPVVITVNCPLNGDNVDQNVFIADRAYQVVEVKQAHATAGTDVGAVTCDVKKATGTTAIASGTTVLGSTFDMKATINTVVTKNLANGGVVSTAVAKLAAGDRLGLDYTGVITALAGFTMTIVLQPLRG